MFSCQNVVYIHFLSPHAFYVTDPSNTPWFGHPNNIWRSVFNEMQAKRLYPYCLQQMDIKTRVSVPLPRCNGARSGGELQATSHGA
jgi:hypothetical protein